MILAVYRKLLQKQPRLRLVIVPRHPQRFDEVAYLIEDTKFTPVRRSAAFVPIEPAIPPVVLGDTMGELRLFYSLANVVFVGRSLVDLGQSQHGSDMIEPAALGKPVVVGKYTTNFNEAVRKLKAAEGLLEVKDAEGLEEAVGFCLTLPAEAQKMGRRAQTVVLREQGSTARHAAIVFQQLTQRLARTASQS